MSPPTRWRGRWPAGAYLPDEGLATAVYLALKLRRPLLLEGEPGVGKTEVANVLAAWIGGGLIRLQCYEGIDSAQAVYEWDYARQLLYLRAAEATGRARSPGRGPICPDELYDERFLVRRPLLRAIEPSAGPPPVLLVDEVDRADDEFEAFLLEILSDYSVTVPEVGTFAAAEPPVVVVTSNRTRDVHDAPQAAVPVPLGGPPRPAAGDRHHPAPGARGERDPGPPGGLRRGLGPGDRPVQAAGGGRDHRLGPGPWPCSEPRRWPPTK